MSRSAENGTTLKYKGKQKRVGNAVKYFLALGVICSVFCAVPVAFSQTAEHPLRISRDKLSTNHLPAGLSPGGELYEADTVPFTVPSVDYQPKLPVRAVTTKRPSDVPSPQPSASGDGSIAQLEFQMWQRVNRDRADNGSPPIRLDPQLSNLARSYAQYMERKNFFAHVDPQGRNPEDRARQAGITSGVYENISWCSRDGNDLGRLNESESDMMAEPRNERNHRSNILGTTHGAVGIGVARNGNKIYMVQEYTD